MMHLSAKKLIRRAGALLLCAPLLLAPALAEEDLLIEEIVEYVDLDAETYGDVAWNFPVALEDLKPDLVVLANKHYLLDSEYCSDDLVTVKTRNSDGSNGGVLKASNSKMQLDSQCALALHEMCEAAMKDGYKLYLKSAYRSYKTQKTMYYNRLEKNNGVDDGWVSRPGSSDHQTGLGCDVVPRSWRDKAMNGKMGAEPECQWMAEHCQEYGFILRYPEDKEAITEINYEPWHMRYVGLPVAKYIMENNLCLEEFTDQLQEAIQDFVDRGGDPSYVRDLIQTPAE